MNAWLTRLMFYGLCAIVWVPQSEGASGPSRPDNHNIAEITERAATLPVEYQATIFFEAVESRPDVLFVPKQTVRYTALFDRASRATFRSRLFYGGHNPQSLESQEDNELSSGHLDELSIRAALVEYLSTLAPRSSFELLRSISLPARSIPCEQASVPNYEAYYEALIKLSRTRSSQPLWSQDDLLNMGLTALNSPSMLEAWLHSMPKWDLQRDQWLSVSHGTAERFEALRPTDREMSALERGGRLSEQVSFLIRKLRSNNLDTTEVIGGYRDFLTRGLSGKMCSDYTIDRRAVLERFAALVHTGQPSSPVRNLELRDISGTPGTAAVEDIIPYDPRLASAMQRLFALSDANRVRRYISHDQLELQPEESDVYEVLKISREDYEKNDKCQVCRFDARQAILSALLNTLPAGKSLRTVLNEEIGFIEFSPIEEVSPPAWLLVFEQTLNTSRPVDRDTAKALETLAQQGRGLVLTPSDEAAEIRLRLSASSDPIIRTFWQAEKVLKPPYRSPMLQGH